MLKTSLNYKKSPIMEHPPGHRRGHRRGPDNQ